MTTQLSTRPTLPASAAQLQESLRRHRKSLATAQQPKERKPMSTYRTKLDPQEEAELEALLRGHAGEEDLADWRSAHNIHHKTFAGLVRRLRARYEAPRLSPAVQLTVQEPPPAAQAIITASPPAPAASSTQIEPVITWLTTIRAMRDELAGHGVTVTGSHNIQIDL